MLQFRFLSTHRTTLLFLCLLFHHLSAGLAQLNVPVDFYTDNQCLVASTENPTASIPLSSCIVTSGLGSISFTHVPCTSGNVQLVGYKDTLCVTQLGILDWYHTDTCIIPYNGDIAAILFTCKQVNDAGTIDPGKPTATSTIAVGPVADAAPTISQSTTSTVPPSLTTMQTVATSSPSSGGGGVSGGSSSSLANTQTAASGPQPSTSSSTIGQTAASTPPSLSGGTSSSLTATQTATSASPSSSTSSSSSGLSESDNISLGVGLGVGIPTIIITAWAAWAAWKHWRR